MVSDSLEGSAAWPALPNTAAEATRAEIRLRKGPLLEVSGASLSRAPGVRRAGPSARLQRRLGGRHGQRLARPRRRLLRIVEGGLGQTPVGGVLPGPGRAAVDPGRGAFGGKVGPQRL